jgi:hypothetical protein
MKVGDALPKWARWSRERIKGIAAVIVALTVLGGAVIQFWPLAYDICEKAGLCASGVCDPDDIFCGL